MNATPEEVRGCEPPEQELLAVVTHLTGCWEPSSGSLQEWHSVLIAEPTDQS